MTTPTHSSSTPLHLTEPAQPPSGKSPAPASAIQSTREPSQALSQPQLCWAHSTANRCLSPQRFTSQTTSGVHLASHTSQSVCMSPHILARSLWHMRTSLMAAAAPFSGAVAGFPQGGPPGSGDDDHSIEAIKASRGHHVKRWTSSKPSLRSPTDMPAPSFIIRLPSPDRSPLRGPCDTGRFG